MFQSYPEVLNFLYSNLPMYQRIGAAAYKSDLTNTLRLCSALGNPENRFRSVHVAGTNGKGSTSHMLASIFQTAGYKTGLYTSPHLKDFNERIRIDGRAVSEEFVVDFVNRLRPSIEEIKPSFFEITVAMAFDYFASEKVDVAVVEVGLGGRLDSTNVITPELSLITNIGWDHMDLLGNTLGRIAHEKAGIIKRRVPVVISERQENVADVFIEKAANSSSEIYYASDHYHISSGTGNDKTLYNIYRSHKLLYPDLYIPLQGYYQKKNLAGVLMAIDVLIKNGWSITNDKVIEGLGNVVMLTGLKGRWQKLGERPLIICDTGHNVDGIRAIIDQIRAQEFQKLHFVLGVVGDKDPAPVLSILPPEAFYYFCEAKIPRAMKAQQLAAHAATKGLEGVIVEDVNTALRQATANASADDMIFIGGSTFVVAELENL